MIAGSWYRWRYWIGAKHLVLHALEWVIVLFWIHKHQFMLSVQDELTMAGHTQPATLEDPRGCYARCRKCGKHIHFTLAGQYNGVKWITGTGPGKHIQHIFKGA